MDMNEDTGDFYIMKGKKLKRGLALVLGLMLAAEVPASVATPFQMFDSYAYTGAATVKATSLNAVSYTHLDVYKRQVLSPPMPWPLRSGKRRRNAPGNCPPPETA